MESILFNKSMELCDKVLDVSDVLFKKGKRNFANQLERCCTSIAANISESTQSESRADFIHKLKIASKESRETEFWLRIITRRKIVVVDDKTFDLLNHIQRMISKSIGTSKRKLNNSNNNSILSNNIYQSDNNNININQPNFNQFDINESEIIHNQIDVVELNNSFERVNTDSINNSIATNSIEVDNIIENDNAGSDDKSVEQDNSLEDENNLENENRLEGENNLEDENRLEGDNTN